jgi:hypothetical protein
MWRIVGILVAIVGLFIAQSVYDFYLSRNYTELEAVLVAYEENCFFEKDRFHGPYFDCGSSAPKVIPASSASESTIQRHANLTYRYRVASESDFREVRTESWVVEAGKFWVGQKRTISVKNDDPAKVLWSRLVI